jgi:signal transduction histidine kinase
MSFRPRLLVTFLAAVLIPIIALAFFVRGEMTDRLTAQYEHRVDALLEVIEEDLARDSEAIATSLSLLRQAIVDDNHFRRAAVDRTAQERHYLLDYASKAMQLAGLSMLQIQDETGRIISSGHFRNEYDRLEPELPKLLASAGSGVALVQARAPDAPFLALARVDSFRMSGKRFTIVAGKVVAHRFLQGLTREEGMTVVLNSPDGVVMSSAYSVEAAGGESQVKEEHAAKRSIKRELSVPFIDSKRSEIARAVFLVTYQLDELHALRRSIDRWFLIAVAAAVVFSIILVYWFASRISRPLIELAEKTSHIDLERLDIDFSTRRRDEIGALSRLLGTMTDRLRASAAIIKDAERRATLGELARQVNHDIKNGLTPIRNVFRHLAGLARDNPNELSGVFHERQNTLDSSISYLENLASNYARLSTKGEQRPCDVNSIIRQVISDRESGRVKLQTDLCEQAIVMADPLSLRRIFENLVDNAIDSCESQAGNVTAGTELLSEDASRPLLRISVTDTGKGMNMEQQARAFDDFYTTKENGTGLGLSIVRRLIMDLDGSIHVESEAGKGSRFIVDLPIAPSGKAK